MQDALNTIWEVKPDPKSRVWQFVKARLLSFGMVLGIGFLLLASLLLSAALTAVTNFWSDFLPLPAVVLQLLDFLLSFAVVAALFAMIFKLLPDVHIAWSDVWVGAVITSILFTIGKFAIGLYVGKSVSASPYGAAGSLVIIVAWIYYSAQILYFGAEFTQVYAKQYGSRGVPEAGAKRLPKPKQQVR